MSVTYKAEVEVDGPSSNNNGYGQEIKNNDRVDVSVEIWYWQCFNNEGQIESEPDASDVSKSVQICPSLFGFLSWVADLH